MSRLVNPEKSWTNFMFHCEAKWVDSILRELNLNTLVAFVQDMGSGTIVMGAMIFVDKHTVIGRCMKSAEEELLGILNKYDVGVSRETTVIFYQDSDVKHFGNTPWIPMIPDGE